MVSVSSLSVEDKSTVILPTGGCMTSVGDPMLTEPEWKVLIAVM